MNRHHAMRGFGALGAIGLFFLAAAAFAGSSKVDGPYYVVTIETSLTGDSGSATITIAGKTVYHCNKAFPWKLQPKPSDGVTFEKDKYRAADAAYYGEDKIVFKVPYKVTPNASNALAFFKGSLCDNKQCQTVQVDLSWPVK